MKKCEATEGCKNKRDYTLIDHNSKKKANLCGDHFEQGMKAFLEQDPLSRGFNVIIDDTNLAPKHWAHLEALAKEVGAEFEVKDFTDVSIEECIKRDLTRSNSVGEKVIRKMYNDFLRPVRVVAIHDERLPHAVMCDIDGTLALFGKENPYERDFLQDKVNRPVLSILKSCQVQIILVSGRNGKFLEQTHEWLKQNKIDYDRIYMRAEGDNRKDTLVKEEIYKTHIQGKFNIDFVLDDRDSVVELWRSLGLTCLQVAEGDF